MKRLRRAIPALLKPAAFAAILLFGAAGAFAEVETLLGGLESVLETRGIWLGLVAVYFGGLALNLTPCVYPMIPVTLAYFGGQSSGKPGKSLALALAYVLGISVSYAVLGMVAAKSGSLLGSWLQQPAVLVGIALVIVALSLSLFGFYDLTPPSFIMRRIGRGSAGAGGAFLMGLGVGVIAAPCIGPFVLGLFLFIGKLANPLLGLLIFFVLGLGMGTPYLALAMGASSVSRLPKSGAWLVWVKKILGVVLLGLALYFVRPLMPRAAFGFGLAVLMAVAGIYLGFLERTKSQHRLFPWIRRFTGTALLLAGLWLLLPRPEAPAAIAWEAYTPQRLEAARMDGRAAVIDLYADWCLPCIELDHVTFRHPDVVEVLRTMETLRVDVTKGIPEEAEALVEEHNIFGVPTILLFDRQGVERKELRILGFIKPEEAVRRLEQL